MVNSKVIIKNTTGLHMRPAGKVCDAALKYKCKIEFVVGNNSASAKSLLSVLGARIKCGDEIEVVCDGEDEEEALKQMVQMLESHL